MFEEMDGTGTYGLSTLDALQLMLMQLELHHWINIFD